MIDIFTCISKYIENPKDTINLSQICKDIFLNKQCLYLYNQFKFNSFKHTKYILDYNPIEIKSINLSNNNRYMFAIIKNKDDLNNISNHIYKLIFHETYCENFINIPDNITHIVFNCDTTTKYKLILPKKLKYLRFNHNHRTDIKLPESLIYLKTRMDPDLQLYYLPKLKYLTTKYHTEISYYTESLIELTTTVHNIMPNLSNLVNLKKLKLYINSTDNLHIDISFLNLEYLKIINNCEINVHIDINSKYLKYLELHNIQSYNNEIKLSNTLINLKTYNCYDLSLDSPINLKHLEIVSSDFNDMDLSKCKKLKYLKIDTNMDKPIYLPKNLNILNIKCTCVDRFNLELPLDNDLEMIYINVKPKFTTYKDGLLNIIKYINNIKNGTVINIDSKIYKYIKKSNIEYLELQ